jgi:hypothetical protein
MKPQSQFATGTLQEIIEANIKVCDVLSSSRLAAEFLRQFTGWRSMVE